MQEPHPLPHVSHEGASCADTSFQQQIPSPGGGQEPHWTTRSRQFRLLKGWRFYREYGIGSTANLIRKNIGLSVRGYLDSRFDRKFNVDTSGIRDLDDLTCVGSNEQSGHRYEPTPIRTLKLIFSLLPQDARDLTFIDFGSGKGRTLLFASNFNFRTIIGVEFARELHTTAQKNIASYRHRNQKCFDLRSVCIDASSFSLPDERCVCYFYDPFHHSVTKGVLANIKASYERCPRKIIVLYCLVSPKCEAAIRSLGFLRKSDERSMPFDLSAEPHPNRRVVVYES